MFKQKYIQIKISSLATAMFLVIPFFHFSMWILSWNLAGDIADRNRYASLLFSEISAVSAVFLPMLALICAFISLISKSDDSNSSGYKWDRYEDYILLVLSLGLFGILFYMMA